jgi:hypothetical protein
MEPCRICKRRPTAPLVIRRHVGMVLMQRFIKVKAPLCRDCGRKLTADYTKQTLVQGWWGLISFFVNWFCLATNLIAYRRASALPEPHPVGVSEHAA